MAFGSTRKPLGRVDIDPTLSALVGSGVTTSCIVGKSWDFHVTEALRTTLDEGAAMVGDSVRFLRAEGQRVFFDAEHFFDGYKANPEYALRVLEAAATEGAEVLVLCDTNGGSLPHEVQRIVGEVAAYFGPDQQIGIHTQNDTGCAVANTVVAVVAGATQRAGHRQRLRRAHRQRQPHDGGAGPPAQDGHPLPTRGSHRAPDRGEPARGRAGQPAPARRRPLRRRVGLRPQGRAAHLGAWAGWAGPPTSTSTPLVVGNHTRVLVSDLGGRAGMSIKAAEFGVDLDDRAAAELSERLKHLEAAGYQFEAADASLELLMREASGWTQPYFNLEGYRVTTYHRNPTRPASPSPTASR